MGHRRGLTPAWGRSTRLSCVLAVAALVGCGSDGPVVAVYDASARAIPMPNDLWRDAEAGRLDLPGDGAELGAADREYQAYLETLDGWSSAAQATVAFSGAVDGESIDDATVQVYRWTDALERVTDATVTLDAPEERLRIAPPRAGWALGGRYVVVVRGGASGVTDLDGGGIEADDDFRSLRRETPLDVGSPEGAALEARRLELAPVFDVLAERAVDPMPREEIAALWSFTVTERAELAMDRPSERMPLPFDALRDHATGRVALPAAAWDEPIDTDTKTQANELDGFAVSSQLLFEFTTGLDPTTVTEEAVAFYELGGAAPRAIPATYRVMAEEGEAPCLGSPLPDSCKYVLVIPANDELPLELGSTYAVVVRKGVLAHDGGEVAPMPMGHFMMAEHPLAIDGASQVAGLDDDEAVRLEVVRQEIAPLLDALGRDDLVTAWPFTTLTVDDELERWSNMASILETSAQPANLQTLTVEEAVATLFPDDTVRWAVTELVYPSRLEGIDRVIDGTIPSPYFLGQDRRLRSDGDYEMQDVGFRLTIPEGVEEGEEVPLVIFTHGVVMDRRWVVLIAGEFAKRGYAMLSFELPFHGERTTCVERSLLAIPNFFPPEIASLLGYDEPILQFAPCASGSSATCTDDGQCLTEDGQPDELTVLPLVDMYPASGAGFVDLDDIPHIKDHFLQGLADMSSVHRAIFDGDWSEAGIAFDLDRVHFTGLSMGSVFGAIWVPYVDGIDRSVLNVVGADLVDLFLGSTFFSGQVGALLGRLGIAEGSYQQERFFALMRWLTDSVDPHTVGRRWAEHGLDGLVQQCVGDIIVPNAAAEPFVRVSELPDTAYDSPLHINLIVPGDALYGDPMLKEMADFIDAPP